MTLLTKKNTCIISLVVALFTLIFVVYNSQGYAEDKIRAKTNPQTIAEDNKETQTKKISIHADLATYYDSLSELSNDSSNIVKIKVQNTETIMYEDTPFTLSTVSISRNYKGDVTKGQKIKILELGGTTKDFVFDVDGNDVLKNNDTAILYLTKYVGPITSNAYVVNGAFQGKFKIDKNGQISPPKGISENLQFINNEQDLELQETN